MRVTKEQFLMGGMSNPRNGILSNLFRRIGLAEKAGYGGQRILDVAQKNSLKTPEIISEKYSTTLRLWKVDFAHSIPENLTQDAQKIYLFLYERKVAKKKEIKKKLELSEYKSKAALTELRNKGYVTKIGESRATAYEFNLSAEMRTSQGIKLLKQLEDFYRG